ncbi:MAG: FG-GAP-like repeat-containing protein [Nannocystaceae bacterium]|nr:FG-GAP-like repeat-containing protein [bacterium]
MPLSTLLAVSCGGSPSSGSDDTGQTSGINPSGTDGSESTAAETTDDASTSSADDTTGGDGPCMTVLCGPSGTCCEPTEDCVTDQCQPACASGVRCGEAQDVCCEDGQVCLANTCEDAGESCVDSFDCGEGFFCEPTLEQCLPQLDPVECEVVPEFEEIAVTLEWSFEDHQVISIPIVADLDGDGGPEVVINVTQQEDLSWPGGRIIVLDGATGAVEYELDEDPAGGTYGSHGRSTPGVTDVNGDGLPDIVYAGRSAGGSPIIAVDGATGTLLWISQDAGGSTARFSVENGAPSFANFDDDPEAEIVFGAAMLDNDGLVVWDEGGNGAAIGTNAGYTGGISALADLTGDGYPEVVSGAQAWIVDWQDDAGAPVVSVAPLWDAGGDDGYPAIADLDLDGDPEVVLVANGNVRVLEGDNGLAWCGVDPTQAMCDATPALRTTAVAIPGGGRGGPPTIADFDGDGRPEIAAAGGASYTVYDLYREGEVIAGPSNPSLGDIFERWSRETQDQSSNATGSSVFDFQGDGAAEVIYADECFMRVYDGSTGAVLVEEPSSSATIHEYPLVVDVDDDGNSEILVVANDSHGSCNAIEGYEMKRGVFVYGDAFDRWVGTRRVWTSHAYHVTNATSAGNAPAMEVDNWTQAGLNNYRQNVQGAGVFNAPDLEVDLQALLSECSNDALVVVATVRNAGALGVPAGVEVTLYEGQDASGTEVGTQATAVPLLPGQTTQLSWEVPIEGAGVAMDFFVVVDGADEAAGSVEECDEENNDAVSLDAECPIAG